MGYILILTCFLGPSRGGVGSLCPQLVSIRLAKAEMAPPLMGRRNAARQYDDAVL